MFSNTSTAATHTVPDFPRGGEDKKKKKEGNGPAANSRRPRLRIGKVALFIFTFLSPSLSLFAASLLFSLSLISRDVLLSSFFSLLPNRFKRAGASNCLGESTVKTQSPPPPSPKTNVSCQRIPPRRQNDSGALVKSNARH